MGAESQAGILHEDGAVDDTSRGATLLVADLAQFTLDLFQVDLRVDDLEALGAAHDRHHLLQLPRVPVMKVIVLAMGAISLMS